MSLPAAGFPEFCQIGRNIPGDLGSQLGVELREQLMIDFAARSEKTALDLLGSTEGI